MVTPPRGMTPDDEGDSVVAGLAGEVDQLRREVAELRGLPERVEELAELITRLAEAPTPASSPGQTSTAEATSWLDMPTITGAEAVRAVLDDLAGWMGTVYLRYADAAQSLPECWAWHPDLVEELLWLKDAWQVAYRSEAASPALAGDWHDRQRPGVVRRIKAVAGMCSIENHDADAPAHRPATDAPLPEAFDVIASWWASDRHETPPTPGPDHHAAARARQTPGTRRR